MGLDMIKDLSRALVLEYVTLGWNVVEAALAIVFAGAASSVALLGFGLDSVVESLSAGVLLWRLYAERGGADGKRLEAVERRARRLVAASLFVLAAAIVFEAGRALWMHEHAARTVPGIVLLVAPFVVMGLLAGAKKRAARAVGSKAMESDAFQTTTCMWLSATALVGLVLNATLGWWWADPIAALALTWFVISEGREAWRGEDACCEHD